MQHHSLTPLCGYCSRPLKGRSDKKFCDDQCRNTYNNQRNRSRNQLVQELNRKLLRNRTILEAIWEGAGVATAVRWEELAGAGFHFQYHTHTHTNRRGALYRYCYEYGLLQLEPERFLVVKDRLT